MKKFVDVTSKSFTLPSVMDARQAASSAASSDEVGAAEAVMANETATATTELLVGNGVGESVGSILGSGDGVGCCDGKCVGNTVGTSVGRLVGAGVVMASNSSEVVLADRTMVPGKKLQLHVTALDE